MDALPTKLRNPRALAAAAAVLVIAVLALLFLRGDDAPSPRSGTPAATPSPPEEHAAWNFRVRPAGAARVTGRQRRAVEEQEEEVSAVVAAVNDALILGEGDLDAMPGSTLTRDAARALRRSPLTLGEEVTESLARRRRARIGVDVDGADRAVATSVVVARVTAEGDRVRVRYETTLWLEKARRGWRVFAFDGKRKRA